ncbi:MAG: recombinase family protein [Eubacterium sp.]|nr:recombinase family protein [Eubacterium sp.]
MKENSEKITQTEERKQRIRERYKGVSIDELDFIPASKKEKINRKDAALRVAVYARVSTDDPNQTSSYELQKNHYNDFVREHPNWNLVKIYADEGISGTSLNHRDSFIEMLHDCKAGKIDMIVTKTVSRFARNIVDCIEIERDLKKLSPPVGVLFETENIFTLDEDCEVLLSIMAMMAQEESHTKSEIMNASIEMRFRRGIFLTPSLLGYDRDENGDLIINEDEAKIVRLIFYMYLDGYTCQEIADTLTDFGQSTKKGNTVWSAGSILQILQNERHCGDVLARKTWTPNFLDHKSKRNKQDRNQYRKRNHHEAIISRDDFIAVQQLISNAKYGNKGFLPELRVITEGILKGYVAVNPRWAGFKPEDYYEACDSIVGDEYSSDETNSDVEAQSGDFDLRGYEVARAQFFDTPKSTITFSRNSITFSSSSVRKFTDCLYVELLFHPRKRIFAVRQSTKENRSNIQWAKMRCGRKIPAKISGTAFLPALYKLLDWNENCKYRITGQFVSNGEEAVLFFDIRDMEILIPADSFEGLMDGSYMTPLTGGKKNVLAYPKTWANAFGNNYYKQIQSDKVHIITDETGWNSMIEGKPYKEPDLHITAAEKRRNDIAYLTEHLKREEINGN